MSEPSKGGPPPWFQPEMLRLVEWRDGDIVISVPVKSGTTWAMNIVYQLLTGGDPDFEDIYAEVPWIELLQRPGQPPEEMLDRIAAMPHDSSPGNASVRTTFLRFISGPGASSAR